LARLVENIQILETGVAAGRSTNTILHALNQKQQGLQILCEITTKVGELIDQDFIGR